MKKLKVAQLGIGCAHAAGIYPTVLSLPEEFEMVALGVPEEEQGFLSASCYRDAPVCSVEALLNRTDLDGVFVEAAEENLVKYAQLVADRGIPLHMDKPGGTDYEAFQTLIETCRKKNLPFLMGYMYRFNPAVRRCLQWKDEGRFGRLFSFEAQMSISSGMTKLPGGMLFFLGCHLIDLCCSFLGEPDEVLPMSGNVVPGPVPDYGMAALRYGDVWSFVKTTAREVNGFPRRQLAVCGTEGSALIQPLETFVPHGGDFGLVTQVHATFPEHNPAPCFDRGEDISFPVYGRYTDMVSHFGRAIRGEEPSIRTYDHELLTQRTLLRACGMM